MSRQYLSCAQTAKLVRQALKESFPGVKFGVRSSVYSGGASIDVKWTDGPTGETVDEVLDQFEGAYFDGMIDYKGSRHHTLDGQPVHFSADFVSGQRSMSYELASTIAARLSQQYGQPVDVVGQPGHSHCYVDAKGFDVRPYMVNEAEKELGTVERCESRTLARIAFMGDDGYGCGTIGMPGGSGGEQCYKAMAARVQP